MKPIKERHGVIRNKPVILYEDRHILVAVKPPGMLSQGDITRAPDMLTEIKKILWEKSGQTRRPFLALVHRLDRPTSGLMVFARSSKAASRLAKAFRERQVVREYVAITRGIPEETGFFTDSISIEKEKNGRVQVSRNQMPDRKKWREASLSWKRLSIDWQREESLLLVTLSTGRKHQIRAQFAASKMPLLGDRRYGKGDARDRNVPTVALHACRLTFTHPVSKTVYTFKSMPDINPSFSDQDGIVLKGALERNKPDLLSQSP